MGGLYDAFVESSSCTTFLQSLISYHKRRVMFLKHKFAQTKTELGIQRESQLKNPERKRDQSN